MQDAQNDADGGDAAGLDHEAAGRAMVRAGLIERLAQAGVACPAKLGLGGMAAMEARLLDRLAYLSPDNLATLAELILDHAVAQHGAVKRWPAEVLVLSWAEALQKRPFALSRIASSWLRSIEGPQAEAAGYLTELYRWLRNHGRPPLPYDLRDIRAKAVAHAREVEVIRGRMARDAASDLDRQWLAAYLRDAQDAADFVATGVAGRAARQDGFESGGVAA